MLQVMLPATCVILPLSQKCWHRYPCFLQYIGKTKANKTCSFFLLHPSAFLVACVQCAGVQVGNYSIQKFGVQPEKHKGFHGYLGPIRSDR